MSDEKNSQLACVDKIAYETPDEARAADSVSSYRFQKPQLKVYKCRHCKMFHLTNNDDDD